MQNVNIDGIGNIETVKALFSQVNCLREDNIFLAVLNYDYLGSLGGSTGQVATANGAVVGSKVGGAVGGIVGGAAMSAFSNAVNEATEQFMNSLDARQKIVFDTAVYGGYLVNIIPEGIGIIPLSNNGKLTPSYKNLSTDMANFIFFYNEEIEALKLEKLPLRLSTRKLALYFKNTPKSCPRWVCPQKEKLIPYQEENFKKLSSRQQG